MSGIVGQNTGRGSGLVKKISVAADSVTGSEIADDAIDSEHYTDGSIDNAHIADDAIDSEHYAAASIDNAHLADDAVDSDELAAGAVDTAHIADNQVTLAKMAGLARGKLIYGDSSGDPAALAVGSANQVLTHDGTDLAWADSSGFDVSSITGATELSVNPADTDEFVFSDGGTLKRINFQRLQSTNAACRMSFSPSGCTLAIANTTDTTSALGGDWSVGGNATTPSGNSNWSQDSAETMDDATNGRIYVRTEGIYMAHVQLLWEANTTGHRMCRFRDDTGYILGWTDKNHEVTYTGLGEYSTAVMQATIEEVGDYFYFELYQNSGGNLLLKGNGNPDRTSFCAWRVS